MSRIRLFSRLYEKDWILWIYLYVDYDATAIDDILDIQKYLMKNHDINNVWIYV